MAGLWGSQVKDSYSALVNTLDKCKFSGSKIQQYMDDSMHYKSSGERINKAVLENRLRTGILSGMEHQSGEGEVEKLGISTAYIADYVYICHYVFGDGADKDVPMKQRWKTVQKMEMTLVDTDGKELKVKYSHGWVNGKSKEAEEGDEYQDEFNYFSIDENDFKEGEEHASLLLNPRRWMGILSPHAAVLHKHTKTPTSLAKALGLTPEAINDIGTSYRDDLERKVKTILEEMCYGYMTGCDFYPSGAVFAMTAAFMQCRDEYATLQNNRAMMRYGTDGKWYTATKKSHVMYEPLSDTERAFAEDKKPKVIPEMERKGALGSVIRRATFMLTPSELEATKRVSGSCALVLLDLFKLHVGAGVNVDEIMDRYWGYTDKKDKADKTSTPSSEKKKTKKKTAMA